MTSFRIWIAALVFGVGGVADSARAAEGVCYQYRGLSSAPWVSSASAAFGQWAAWCGDGNAYSCKGGTQGQTNCTWSAGSFSGEAPSAITVSVSWSCGADDNFPNGTNGFATMSIQSRVNPDGCPPDPCAGSAGKTLGLVSYADQGLPEPPSTMCTAEPLPSYEGGEDVPASCGMSYTGRGVKSTDDSGTRPAWGGIYRATGEGCTGGTTTGDANGTGNCITSASGQGCVDKANTGKNCGTLNGERVCLAAVPPGQCVLTPGAAAVCTQGASSAPVFPETGDPVPPDFTLTSEDTGGGSTTYNYYSNTTLAGAGGGGVLGGSVGPDGGEYGGDDDGEGEGGAATGEVCAAGEDCYGEHPDASCIDDVGACALGALAGLGTVVSEIPVIGFVTDLYAAVPVSSTCPQTELSLLGETYDAMAPFCSILTGNVAALFSLVMHICWSFAGLRIMLGAE